MRAGISFLFFVLACCQVLGQDTTKILFVGNSFTYYNNMPQMVQSLAAAAGLNAYVAMHAPGGISVGDTVQGTQAHMNNPILFNLIRSKAWDVVVIQDNQGRFVRDSAQFSTSSKVVEGHLKLMDSVKAVNSCAKIVLFGGWAFKNGSPPYGNTGIEMIRRILRNYVVLNDTMQEVVAPIGEAWIKGVNNLPAVNLWDTDDAHPSYAGSYLTGSVLFSTIFNLPAQALNYNGTLVPATAASLRVLGDSAVFGPAFHTRYNLGGIKTIVLQELNGQLSVPGTFSTCTWYQGNTILSSGPVFGPSASGSYRALVQENDGCLVKSCSYNYSATTTGLAEANSSDQFCVYPNPVSGAWFMIRKSEPAPLQGIDLFNLYGSREAVAIERQGEDVRVSTKGLKPGCYVLLLTTANRLFRKTIVVEN